MLALDDQESQAPLDVYVDESSVPRSLRDWSHWLITDAYLHARSRRNHRHVHTPGFQMPSPHPDPPSHSCQWAEGTFCLAPLLCACIVLWLFKMCFCVLEYFMVPMPSPLYCLLWVGLRCSILSPHPSQPAVRPLHRHMEAPVFSAFSWMGSAGMQFRYTTGYKAKQS